MNDKYNVLYILPQIIRIMSSKVDIGWSTSIRQCRTVVTDRIQLVAQRNERRHDDVIRFVVHAQRAMVFRIELDQRRRLHRQQQN